MLARNPAARGDDPLAAATADPEAARYRLTREARLNGVAAETAADGRSRVVVTRHGRRTPALAHRAGRGRRAPPPRCATPACPGCASTPTDRVLDANAAAAALAGGPPEPRRCSPTCRCGPTACTCSPAPASAVRAVMLPGADGSRDLLLVPLDGAEVSGLVPDHFLDELPVALARLETDGRLTYANTRRAPAARRARDRPASTSPT